MQTAYIYSASRVNTLAQFLLSKTDIERLLVAEPGEELQSALKETYLAPYVLRVEDEDVTEAIEATLIDAKRLVHGIAPNGDMFRVLWVHYDIHNLRVFAKAQAKGLSYGQVQALTSRRGIYEPEVLFGYVERQQLNHLQPGWQEAYDAAVEHVHANELDRVDGVFDQLFFDAARRIAQKSGDAFIHRLMRTMIDVYNLKSALRGVTFPQINFTPMFIEGGSFGPLSGLSREEVCAAFERLAPAAHWQSALEFFNATGNTSQIDARCDELLVDLAKEASFDMFSSASLVLYYLLCRQAAANIRTIVVGRNSGQSEEAIRANLRLAYVND